MPVGQRINALKDSMAPGASSPFTLLTPAEFAELFPKYYQKALPDVGGFREAISKKSAQRQEDIMEGLATNQGITVDRAEKIGRTQRLGRGQPDVMDRPERTNRSKTEVKKIEHATAQQTAAYNKVKQGPVTADSDEGKLLGKFSDNDLKSFGVEKTKDKDGKTVFSYKPPEVTTEEATTRFKQSSQSKNAFFNKVYNEAYSQAKEKGFPHPDVIARLAAVQASHESGYGSRAPGNNYFGIKGAGQSFATHEEIGGRSVGVNQSFKVYGGLSESVSDYLNLMKKGRYREVYNASTVDEAIGAQGRSGYASDSQYGAKLGRVNSSNVGVPIEPEGPNGQYSERQKQTIEQMRQQMVREIGEGQGREYDKTVIKYEKEHNLPPGTLGQELTAGVDVSTIKLTGKTTAHKGDGRQCADLSKYYAPGIGHASEWKFHSGHDGMVPGAVIATTNYGNGNAGKEASAFDGVSHFHTGVLLTVPDANGNALIYDQARGHGARITRVNVNNYNGTGTPMAVINGGESSEQSRRAIEDAKSQGSPAEVAAIDQSLTGKVSILPTETPDAAKIQEDSSGPDNVDHENKAVESQKTAPQAPGQETKQTPASATVEPPKSANSKFKFDAEKYYAEVDAKHPEAKYFGYPKERIMKETYEGFDKAAKEGAIKWNKKTGEIEILNPDHPTLQEIYKDMEDNKIDKNQFLEKVAAASLPTNTASIGEKLQREFGVASAQASTQGDAFAREEAYRKAHPYGPEMPTQQDQKDQKGTQLKDLGTPKTAAERRMFFDKVTKIAKGMGEKFPEVVAYQFAIESGWNNPKNKTQKTLQGANNPFGQTATESQPHVTVATPKDKEGGKTKKFYSFSSVEEAIKNRIDKWSWKYQDAKSISEAMHILQNNGKSGKYAEGRGGDWRTYITDAESMIRKYAGLDINKPYETTSTQFAQAESTKTSPAAPEAPKSSPLTSVFGSGGVAAAEATPEAPASVTPTTVTHTQIPAPTPTTSQAPGREFPKNKSAETPLPPRRDVSAAPSTPAPPKQAPTPTQTGAPDESSTKNFLRSQGVPGASDGGSFNVGDRNIGFYPMDKKDNLAAVDTATQQPLFTAKTGENINVDPMQNRIDVTPQHKVNRPIAPGTQMSEMNDAINTVFDMASSMGRPSDIKPPVIDRSETIQNTVVLDPFLNQKTTGFPTASLERAMSKARGRESDYSPNRVGSGTSIA